MHQTVLVTEDLEPERGHGVHALALRELGEILQKDLAEQCARAQTSFAHAVGIPAEHLRLEQLLQEREEDAFKDDRQVDVGILEDFGSEKSALQAGDGVLSEFARGVQAELGISRKKGDPGRLPGCRQQVSQSARISLFDI